MASGGETVWKRRWPGGAGYPMGMAGGGDEKKAAAINKRRGAATSLVSVDGARGRRRRDWRRLGRPIGSFRNGGA